MGRRDRGTTAFGVMDAGQDLVAAGYIALKGTSAVAAEREKELLERFTPQFVRRCQNLYKTRGLFQLPGVSASEEAAIFCGAGAASWCMAGEGGIMAALWDYFDTFGLGFEIELRKLPVLQETIEVCEVFDVNPYRLQSEGCALLTAANGGGLVRELGKKGIHAVVLGRTQAGIKRQILNGEIRTFLDRPKPDELYKGYSSQPLRRGDDV